MAYPKIIYDTNSILVFTYPPVQKPRIDERDAIRKDTRTWAGAKQTVWGRNDIYKTITVEFIPHDDAANWEDFIEYALEGNPFNYYPNAALPNFATYTLADTNVKPGFSVRNFDRITLKMLKVAASDAPVPIPTPDPVPTTPEPPQPTTPAAVFENNTSASALYVPTSSIATIARNFASASSLTDKSLNQPTGAVSGRKMQELMYNGASTNNTKIIAYTMPWFRYGVINNGHIDVGYNSNDQTQVNRQIADQKRRGFYGANLAWYGSSNTHHDAVAQKWRIGCEADGNYYFAIRMERDPLAAYSDKTAGVKAQLDYANAHFFSSSKYIKYGTRPLMWFFDLNLISGINWNEVRSHVQGYAAEPLFIFRNAGGLDATQSDGAFLWLDTSASGTYRRNYLTDAYPQLIGELFVAGSCYKGFNDTLAGWGTGRSINGDNAQCWLNAFATLNDYFDVGNQIPYLGVPTWNDYEEGTAIETGIASGLTISLASGSIGSGMVMGQGVNSVVTSHFPQCESVRIWDTGCSWHSIATSDGVYNWANLDAVVAKAEAEGVSILYTIGRTPTWASSAPTQSSAYGNNGNAAPPTSNTKYTDFLTALATRYAGRINAYETWNEPNHIPYWSGTINQLYTMVGLGYTALKAADPACTVTTPCPTWGNHATLDNSWEWLDAWFDLGGDAYADDIVCFHGYVDSSTSGYQPEEVASIIDEIRDVMTAHGLGAWELWDTESGWDLNSKLLDSQKVDWLEGWVQIRRDKGLNRSYWYQWDNTSHGTLWTSGGGLTPSGTRWVLRMADAGGDDLIWNITGNENVVKQYNVLETPDNGVSMNIIANVASGTHTYTLGSLAAGTHKVYVRAEMKACIQNKTSNGIFVTV